MKCSIAIFNYQTNSKNKNKNSRYTDRITLIVDELIKFVKLKEYISYKKPEFALYLINQTINLQIEYCNSNDFLIKLNEINDLLQGNSFINSPIDLNEIFVEAYFFNLENLKKN